MKNILFEGKEQHDTQIMDYSRKKEAAYSDESIPRSLA